MTKLLNPVKNAYVTIRGVRLVRPRFSSPITDQFGNVKFSVRGYYENADEALKVANIGIKVYEDDDGDFFSFFDRNAMRRNGKANEPLAIYDNDLNELNGRMVDEGSIADLRVYMKETYKGTVYPILCAVRVTEMVEADMSYHDHAASFAALDEE